MSPPFLKLMLIVHPSNWKLIASLPRIFSKCDDHLGDCNSAKQMWVCGICNCCKRGGEAISERTLHARVPLSTHENEML